jgi:hypothetical protein
MIKNRIYFLALASFLFAFGLSVTANAQYLTSTKAGFVNNVYGKVYIQRADSVDGEKGRASFATQMREGDLLSATAESKAEILMNPGSYIRINENSEVRAVNTDFGAVRFELIKGSVIIEVGEIDKKEPFEIITHHGALTIATMGLYRIDEKGSETLVSVRQGEIYIGSRNDFAANKARKIGRGNVVTLDESQTIDKSDIAKIDRDAADSFDKWSFSRAQTLTAANVSALSRTRVLTAFSGGWYYDPYFGCYTFMPFRSRYYSPYGFGFFNNYGATYYYNPYGYGSYGGYTGNPVGPSAPPRVIAGNDRGPIRRATESRGVDPGSAIDSSRGGFGDPGGFGGSRGISSPSTTSSPSVISAPAPSRGESSGGGGGGAMPSRGRP